MMEQTEKDLRDHAVSEYPRESCGLIVIHKGKERYYPCKNIAESKAEHFILDPQDYAAAEDLGDIVAVVHSHPDITPKPSEADKVSCEATGLVWHIVNTHLDDTKQPVSGDMYTFEPTGYEAPLVGRTFSHGVLDCYSLVQDYYARELGIKLPDFERRDEWWTKGDNLYMDNFARAGCEPIKGPIQVGDIIIMQIRSPVPNHAAVYIGDGLILHHVMGRMSSRDVYSGYWQENTRVVVRYKGDPNVDDGTE